MGDLINLNQCFSALDTEPTMRLPHATRFQNRLGHVETCLDSFNEGPACLSLHIRPHSPAGVFLPGSYALEAVASGGWLLSGANGDADYWIPQPPSSIEIDAQYHLLRQRSAGLVSYTMGDAGLSATFGTEAGEALALTLWRLPPGSTTAQELKNVSPLEASAAFILGSHSCYARPADLYHHLIHGWVYERNYAWPHKRKICSENDAHALYLLFCGLEKATGKTLYRLFKQQLLLSVLSRQDADGGFRHGEWTDDMEAHYRLNASALHMMLDSLAEAPDATIQAAADRLAEYLAKQTDRLDSGTWFLHDELEQSEAAMNRAPFRWVRSRALGKRPSNMLVLNTQLDTSIGLRRHGALRGDTRHAELLASADAATAAVLKLDTAPWLYRPLMGLIRLTLLPTPRAQALPLPLRMLKRLTWKYLLPRLPDIKSRFPRLVMPGGYIDREHSLRTWAHHYLSINLMDLARYRRSSGAAALDPIIHACAQFAVDSGLLERWAELRYEKYALGFWAEALYHLCRIYPEAENYRAWMIQAVLLLEATEQGLPPSLLGANAEAVAPQEQFPCPIPADRRLRIVNLGDRGRPELLVVNPSDAPVALAWHTPPDAALSWPAASVPARGALHSRVP